MAEAEQPLLPPPPPGPGSLGKLRPPLLNVVLFVLTFASAFLSGANLTDTQLPSPTEPEMLRHGAGFAGALLLILLCHEMGHFLYARKHGVDATWPFFIPVPLVSLIGTLGAVIRLRSLPRTRRALLDIGAAGPIAGFLVTLPVAFIGLKLSALVQNEPPPQVWTLFESVYARITTGEWLDTKGSFDLVLPLGMRALQRLAVGPIPEGMHLALHPVAIAGWFGFLLTALNLLPLGQLDGGHVLYGSSPRLHRIIGPPGAALLLALGVFTSFTGWIIWGLLMGLGLSYHPPLEEAEERLDGPRKALVIASVAMMILSFSPVPLVLIAK